MLLIVILGIPVTALAYLHEHTLPAWQFHRRMKARRHRAHTFA